MNDLHLPLSLALSFAGFASLSLAMDRHFCQATGGPPCTPPQRWLFRACGGLLLWLSLWACLAGWGNTVGAVAWWGLLTAGASGVVLGLSYRPRWVPPLALLLGAASLLALAIA